MKPILKTENLTIERTESGVPKIIANSDSEMYYGLGYCHTLDRGMQMIIMKILGKGEASESLNADDEMLEIDKFFRKMNWENGADKEIEKLSVSELALLDSYCKGVNDAFKKQKPWELKMLLGYKNFSWSREDVFLVAKMIGFLTLAQSQGEIERLFVEMVQKDVKKELLEELFPNILDNYDEELLKKIKLGEKIVPDAVKWNVASSAFMASNNWVISGSKTKSGSPLLANDPHLEINRIPPVWYEVQIAVGDRYAFSGTMPGVPPLLVGRKENLAWGTTYAFMDASDSWIEQCKDGKYLKDGNWYDFKVRTEIIKRKKKDSVTVTFYENEHGILDGNPFEEGYYLASKWTGQDSGAKTLQAGFNIWNAKNVKEGMAVIGELESAFSWVLADTNGNIGFQMSGAMPIRNNDWQGFTPAKGWESENDWQGIHKVEDLPRVYNPEEGIIVTTNNNLNHLGKVKPINMPMGEYRADRIKQLLQQEEKATIQTSKDIQYDVYSLQAEYFMKVIKPLLPDTKNGKILKNWDLNYDVKSKGAYLFEMIYRNLYFEVFGDCLGKELVQFLQNDTGVIIDFYSNFDAILLSETSLWFLENSREDIYIKAINSALKVEAKEWGEINNITLSNMLLGGQFPMFFGFDKGPFPLPGGRATVHQGQVYKSAGRKTSFAPSFRMITDMSEKNVHTNLAGGVSDRRFSKLYNNDFENWQNKVFKKFEF